MKGNFRNLAKSRIGTWKGWAVYFWDHAHRVALFDKRPERHGPDQGWNFRTCINEDLCPYLLRACGVAVPFDSGEEFYYEKDNNTQGQHEPIAIELTMPVILLESWNLKDNSNG